MSLGVRATTFLWAKRQAACPSTALAAAVAASLLGHVVDAAVIAAVVIVGFILEGKAEKAPNATRREIAPIVRDLAPGDVVFLKAGDRVPADLRLLRARGPAPRRRRTGLRWSATAPHRALTPASLEGDVTRTRVRATSALRARG